MLKIISIENVRDYCYRLYTRKLEAICVAAISNLPPDLDSLVAGCGASID